MSTQLENQMPRLTANQRNLYNYYLAHKSKHRKHPCFVPKVDIQTSSLLDYLKSLEKLETHKLITVDRTTDNYTGWVIKEPTNI